jgi:hypothetical protein
MTSKFRFLTAGAASCFGYILCFRAHSVCLGSGKWGTDFKEMLLGFKRSVRGSIRHRGAVRTAGVNPAGAESPSARVPPVVKQVPLFFWFTALAVNQKGGGGI